MPVGLVGPGARRPSAPSSEPRWRGPIMPIPLWLRVWLLCAGLSCAEVIPKRDFELGTGLEDGQEGVAAVAPAIAAGAAADLAPGDMAADVIL